MEQKDPILQNEEMRRCFDALPPFLQENIRQSGATFHSADELERYAKNVLGQGK